MSRLSYGKAIVYIRVVATAQHFLFGHDISVQHLEKHVTVLEAIIDSRRCLAFMLVTEGPLY